MKRLIKLAAFCLLTATLTLWVWVEAAHSPAERAARARGCLLCHGSQWQQEAAPALRQWQPGTPVTPLLQEALLRRHPLLSRGRAADLADWVARCQLQLLADTRRQSLGESLYHAKCAACHGKDGEGLQGTYPPLQGSEWLTREPSPLPEILTKGLRGPISVRGQEWNATMLPPGLSNDNEVQAIVEYIRRRFAE